MRKLFLIITFLLIQINTANANSNISFIDMDKLLSTSKPGQSILKQLNDIRNKDTINFQKQEKILKENEKKLISQKNLVSAEDFESNLNKLRLEINQYNENKRKKIKELQNLKINSTNKFLKLINPILIEYSENNSIPLILQKKSIIAGKSELDITDEIIKKVNSDLKVFRIN
tara:strand:+ start:232 stop:750 length:519 start_codon:yes stop_codon:yes gene_type:complete